MTLTDEEFREEYKPLYIPSHYQEADTQENKIVYALAQLGEGTVTEVIEKLEALEPNITNEQLTVMTEQVLSHLFDRGLIKGEDHHGQMRYNLSKITEANKGSVNPDLLAPGLD
jgi:predicted transcriptional regulator